MTLGSLFDGIGGFPLAAIRNGITPIWASEKEAAPISITKRHFPNMKHLGDITKINGAEIEPVDIITFGSPCQDLSIAGKRTGIEGDRSGLFMEAVRIIKEMREKTNGNYPTRIIWENVTGAFSSNKGEDFKTVIQEIAYIKEKVSIPKPKKWESAGFILGNGYSIAWRVLDAQYWGVPQRRKRIFLVADFRGQSTAEILFKPESLSGDIKEGGTERKDITGDSENSIREAKGVDGYNQCLTGDVAQTIRGSSSCGDSVGMVLKQYAVDFGRTADRIQMNADKAVTLQGEGGGCGAKTGLYCLPVFCIQGNTIERSDEAGANGKGVNENISFTLSTTDRHAVAYDCRNHVAHEEVSGTLQAKDNGGQSLNYINPVFSMQGYGKDSTDLISNGYMIRRLTPIECERLQGFPDTWTEYGHDGRKISDSARYKALGNSLAIPCVDFILSRVKEEL